MISIRREFHFGMATVALLACVGLFGQPACAETAPEAAPPPQPTWDRIANIKDAAARIGKLQKAKGAEAAYKFIDACYRTHSLAENYTAGFEACIAQDYLQTKMLVEIYERTPPEVLKRFRSPTPEALADTMGKRIIAAFAQYKITASDANAFKNMVDRHGVPVFIAIVFPEAARELEAKSKDKKAKP
jgi:hypothetical protein